jgi:MFS superfamily sulfate permease-like transporter
MNAPRLDVVAGLTAAAVVLPKAMAYATVAGLPVAVGLYTAFTPMIVYALLGSSRVLSVSSTTTLAILTGTQLALVVPDKDPGTLITATATLTALVGTILLLARVMRLGFVANFISAPVLTGFKAGIGLVIVLDQIPKLLGIHIAKRGFFRDLFSIAHHIPETSLVTLSIAVATLLVLIGMERWRPHSPAPLVAVGGAIAAVWLFGLQARGVSVVGLIPQGFPSLTMPDLALIAQLVPGALGIGLMSFTETIAAGRAFARPDDPPIDANRELIASGAANLGGALLGSMPAGGGTSQTAVVRAAGVAESVARHRRNGSGNDAAARTVAGASAECRAGRGCDRLLGRVDPTGGVLRDPKSTHDGIPLGDHRGRQRAGVRHPQRHRSGDHHVADRTGQPGRLSACVRHWAQTGYRRAATAFARASGR